MIRAATSSSRPVTLEQRPLTRGAAKKLIEIWDKEFNELLSNIPPELRANPDPTFLHPEYWQVLCIAEGIPIFGSQI